MQTATVQVALGGDKGNTVEKYNVTPAEVAVLRHIHGDDAVTDIHPHGEVERTSRVERQRLAEVYGRRSDNGRVVAPAVDALFPGVASRVFEAFDELDLPEQFFKAATRVSADAADKPARTQVAQAPADSSAPDLRAMTAKQLGEYAAQNKIDLGGASKKAAMIAVIEAAAASAEPPPPVQDDEPEDDIGDMDDTSSSNLFQ